MYLQQLQVLSWSAALDTLPHQVNNTPRLLVTCPSQRQLPISADSLRTNKFRIQRAVKKGLREGRVEVESICRQQGVQKTSKIVINGSILIIKYALERIDKNKNFQKKLKKSVIKYPGWAAKKRPERHLLYLFLQESDKLTRDKKKSAQGASQWGQKKKNFFRPQQKGCILPDPLQQQSCVQIQRQMDRLKLYAKISQELLKGLQNTGQTLPQY